MSVRVIEITNCAEAEKELSLIGSDHRGIEIMRKKAVSFSVKLPDMETIPANIIKQEMLAIGGEAAVAYGSINHSVKKTDVLLFGNLRDYELLAEKLCLHQFGLKKTGGDISQAIKRFLGAPKPIKIGQKTFRFGQRTYIMGILNVTPDSFSDGGKYFDRANAVEHAKKMLAEGADIIDVGGESSRPGAKNISAKEEINRVIPAVRAISKLPGAVISIDTRKSEVAAAAVSAGAHMVNDISGLRFDKKMASFISKNKIPVCLMHMQGTPKNMQKNPLYHDLMGQIIDFLAGGIEIAKNAGILLEKIIIDPGIGFGKTTEHNLELLDRLAELKVLGFPILIGASRKAFIGKVLNLPVEDRIEGTISAIVAAIMNGADLVRVHDIDPIKRAARLADAIIRRK